MKATSIVTNCINLFLTILHKIAELIIRSDTVTICESGVV